jgi:hypothetical protein
MLRESCSQFDSLPLTSLTIPLFAEQQATREAAELAEAEETTEAI